MYTFEGNSSTFFWLFDFLFLSLHTELIKIQINTKVYQNDKRIHRPYKSPLRRDTLAVRSQDFTAIRLSLSWRTTRRQRCGRLCGNGAAHPVDCSPTAVSGRKTSVSCRRYKDAQAYESVFT